jgi:hypothetical protein
MTANTNYLDAGSTTHLFQTEAGDAGGSQERPVHGLPAAVVTCLTDVKTAVQALAALISSGKLPVTDTTLGGYVDQLESYTDGLETLVTSSNTKLDTIHTDLATTLGAYLDGIEALITSTNGYVDGLEGYLDTVETKLQSIIDALGVPSGGSYTGYVGSIGTGADVSFSTQALSEGFYIKNVSTAGQVIYYGVSAAPSATTAPPLQPGEVSPFIRASNVTAMKMRASAASGAATYQGN